ncbi:MAG: GNAT family N-acetyltransferase [Candidatus Thermoplasmatota archaeon]
MSQKIIRLRDRTIVRIEPFTGKENAREFQRFINALTREGTYLLLNKLVTLDEETRWLQTQVTEQRKGQQLQLKALVDERLIGTCIAKPGFGRNHGNVNLGIGISKQWRGKGIGHLLLEELIRRSEKKWHPKNMHLQVVSVNKKALQLYESLGFRIIARLPQWFEYDKKFYDEYLLLLDKEQFFQQQNKSPKTHLRRQQKKIII